MAYGFSKTNDDHTDNVDNIQVMKFVRKMIATNVITMMVTIEMHISVGNVFPKKRYMSYKKYIPLSDPIESHAAKTWRRCRILCDKEYTCAAMNYRTYTDRHHNNCELYDQYVQVDDEDTKDVLVETNTKYKYSNGTFYVAYMLDTYVVSSSAHFVNKELVKNLNFEECKTVCIHNVDCTALRYIVKREGSGDCLTGNIIGNVDDTMRSSSSTKISEKYFVLEADPFYTSASYETV